MTKYSDLWDGSVKGEFGTDLIMKILQSKVREIKEGLTPQEVRAIVCETLARNIVMNEFCDMAAYIIENHEEESKYKKELARRHNSCA